MQRLLPALLLLTGCLSANGRGAGRLAPIPGVATTPMVRAAMRAAPARGVREVELLYVTDRAPLEPASPARAYGWERDTTARFGAARVALGDPREPDTVRATRVEELGDLEDRRAFEDAVRARLAATGSGDVYLTVHGIATGFGTSLYHLAQIWEHLGREGAAIAYSWPSGKGGFIMNVYQYERESTEYTVPHLGALLRLLGAMPEVERVHVIAHSLGAGLVTQTLRELRLTLLAEGVDPVEALRLETLVLAAPDISRDLFETRVLDAGVTALPRRTVLYVSEHDKALSASAWMQGDERVGQADADELVHLLLSEGERGRVEVVDCTRRRRRDSHGYYLNDPEVLAHLLEVVGPPGP